MLLATLIPGRPKHAHRGLCCPQSDLGTPHLDPGRTAGSGPPPSPHPPPASVSEPSLPRITISP